MPPPKTPLSSSPPTPQFPGGIPRLDSLGSRSRPASALAAGRFAPKAVARRTKQERDATAPPTFPEQSSAPTPKTERNAISRRGGRTSNRGARFAVSSAAIGPLGAPSNEVKRSGGQQAYEVRHSMNASIDLAAALRGRVKSETPVPQGEEDRNRIDMSRDGPVDSELAKYFPIRLDRLRMQDDDEEENEEDGIQNYQEEAGKSKIKVEPGLEEVKIKAEPAIGESAERARIERKPNKVINDEHTLTADVQRELKRVQNDFRSLAHDINLVPGGSQREVNDNRLYHIQLPSVLPEFTAGEEEVMIIDDDDADVTAVQQPSGRIGKLRLHKSGKITMKIGKIVMNVARGTDNSFLQDVVIYDKDQLSFYQVGQITRKLVVSVDLDKLD
jgi:DNA-directed RNA polymerase III subunit RPC4